VKPYHRKSILHDVCELAPNLAFADKREVETLGHTSEQSLLAGYLYSTYCRSIIDAHGHVVAMYGITPLSEVMGQVWMLGSEKLKKVSRPFLRQNRDEIKIMHVLYPHLCNIIDSRNEAHLRWIDWCGFHILGEKIINNVKFYEFCRLA